MAAEKQIGDENSDEDMDYEPHNSQSTSDSDSIQESSTDDEGSQGDDESCSF